MIYNASNTRRAAVYDVDTMQRLESVVSIDTGSGEVVQHVHPLVVMEGEIVSTRTKYAAVHPIFGGSRMPVLFHCYGRLP